jgi:ribosomal 30S subunit maturation factor RimM
VLGTPVLTVQVDPARVEAIGAEIMVPLAQDICPEVDLAARRIEVNLPEGLLDLNSKT